jgi:hypothetical protein
LSSSDRTNSSRATVEEVKDEDTEVDAAETTSEEEAVVVEVTFDDEATAMMLLLEKRLLWQKPILMRIPYPWMSLKR